MTYFKRPFLYNFIHNILRYTYVHTTQIIDHFCDILFYIFGVWLEELSMCTYIHTILFYLLCSLSFQWWWYIFVSSFLFVNLCLLYHYFTRRSFSWMWSCMHIAWRSNGILWISLVQFPSYILRSDSSHHIKLFLLSFVQHTQTFIYYTHLSLSLSPSFFSSSFSISFILLHSLSPAFRSSLFTSRRLCVYFNWLMNLMSFEGCIMNEKRKTASRLYYRYYVYQFLIF